MRLERWLDSSGESFFRLSSSCCHSQAERPSSIAMPERNVIFIPSLAVECRPGSPCLVPPSKPLPRSPPPETCTRSTTFRPGTDWPPLCENQSKIFTPAAYPDPAIQIAWPVQTRTTASRRGHRPARPCLICRSSASITMLHTAHRHDPHRRFDDPAARLQQRDRDAVAAAMAQ